MNGEPIARRPLGATGLSVSVVGLGAGHIGGDRDEREIESLLHGALDLGITLIDTAPSYGQSEARIGRILKSRRDELVLSTKGGYGAPGAADWTPSAITNGIDAALGRLGTEQIDIFHLHSCPLDVLRRDDLLRALEEARRHGKIRVAAYSGENEALDWAIRSGHFGCVQTSVSLADQRGLDSMIPEAARRGIGVLGKRPLCNLAWRFAEAPVGQYAEVYWRRLQAMGMLDGRDLYDLALRFSAHAPGVGAILVGTGSLEHLRRSLAPLREGPLDDVTLAALRLSFREHDADWVGQI